MPEPSELLPFAASLFAAVNHLYLALLGFGAEGRTREINRLFVAIALISGWYCLWVALLHAGIVDQQPRTVTAAQLFTGYLGPAFFLITRAILDPWRPVPRRLYGLFALGLFGSVLSFYGAADPDRARALWLSYSQGHIEDGTAAFLFAAHTLEVGVLFLASAFLLLRASVTEARPRIRRQARLLLLTVLSGTGALTLTNLLKFAAPGLNLSALGPLLTVPMLGLVYHSVLNSRQVIRDLEKQRAYMSGYLPENVVQRIVTEDHQPELGGVEAEATILFSDLRGFTTLSESLSAVEVVAFLNRYFGVMTQVVFEHHGMVNKYVGDAILAVFGIPGHGRNDARDAVACARAMILALDGFNAQWTAEGHAPLAMGIGLHRGRVVHGNVGSATRMEYTVIGDAVNTASRVEALTKEVGVAVLLTGEVTDALGEEGAALQAWGEEILRGRSAATRLYVLDDPASKKVA